MSIIKIEQLSFAYPGSYDNVFDGLTLQIDTDWRLGLIGRNGRGKTSLLKLLLGEYEFSGKIISSVPFDYFPYAVKDPERSTEEILGELCPHAGQWELLKELSHLGLDAGVFSRSFRTLSKGEQTKVLLAALFLKEGHFLLIDEPTNHLDAAARDLVARYLRKKSGFILVSHDRRFLDCCVDHILALNRAGVEIRKGNFSSWFSNFESQQESERRQDQRIKRDIKRLKQSSLRSAEWSDRVEASKTGAADKGYVGHKAAKMMQRSKSIEARQQRAIEEKSRLLKNQETAEHLKLSPLSHYEAKLAQFTNVQVFYHELPVCGPVSFAINQGDRLFLDGHNGSGKSSILKLLVGEPLRHTGTVRRASGLVISYVPQDCSWMQGSLRQFSTESHIDESQFKAILHKIGFQQTQFEKNIQDLSDGQKKKLLIARSLCQSAHLYVWDEPLNFIDLYSRMQIEQLIAGFAPTMVLVEHDRAFQNAVATELISI